MGQITRMTKAIAAVPMAIGAVLASAASSEDASPPPVDDAAVVAAVLEQVAAGREEIFSARIKYRWHLATYQRAENTPDRVHALLSEHDLVEAPDRLRDIVAALVPEPAPIDPPWEIRSFDMLGDKRRADTSQDVIQLVDGEHEMRYEGSNEQLTIGHRGYSSIHLTNITDFRSYPPLPPGGLTAADFRAVERSENEITLEAVLPPEAPEGALPSRFTFDRATGVMTHSVQYQDGQVSREVEQRALTEYPGGVVMPAVRIATHYRGGKLHTLRVFILENAEFNGPVPEERFVMPVAAGTVLVDHRREKKAVWRAASASDDVRSILVPVSMPVADVSGSHGLSWQMVMVLNGAALIIIATVLWRKGSPSRVNPARSRKTDRS